MPRGKSLDEEVKENLYSFIYEEKLFENYEAIKDIMTDVTCRINQYFKQNNFVLNDIITSLRTTKEELANLLVCDIIVNLYEHIRILDVSYNSNYPEHLKKMGLVRLKDYTKEKYLTDERARRRYMDRFKKDCISKENDKNCIYFMYDDNVKYADVNYHIKNFCDIYHDYIFRQIDDVYLVDKKYSGILDCFYGSKSNKLIKAYAIWDIDATWLPEIMSIYDKCDGFQNHLIERLYHIIAASNIYGSKSRSEDVCFANTIQPLTMFGWGSLLQWLVGRYRSLMYRDYREVAGFLFDAMSSVLKQSLYGILNKVNAIRTNTDKRAYIDTLYLQYTSDEMKRILKDAYQRYKEPISDKINYTEKDFMEICKCLLFNGRFKMYVDNDIISDLEYNAKDLAWEDLGDDEYDENDDLTVYNMTDFDSSFAFDGRQGKLEYFFESVFCDTNNEEVVYDDRFELTEKKNDVYISFDFSDYLYLVTEFSYQDFYI